MFSAYSGTPVRIDDFSQVEQHVGASRGPRRASPRWARVARLAGRRPATEPVSISPGKRSSGAPLAVSIGLASTLHRIRKRGAPAARAGPLPWPRRGAIDRHGPRPPGRRGVGSVEGRGRAAGRLPDRRASAARHVLAGRAPAHARGLIRHRAQSERLGAAPPACGCLPRPSLNRARAQSTAGSKNYLLPRGTSASEVRSVIRGNQQSSETFVTATGDICRLPDSSQCEPKRYRGDERTGGRVQQHGAPRRFPPSSVEQKRSVGCRLP